MTDLEKLLIHSVRLAKDLDDACPDVGMGPTNESLLDDVITSTGIRVEPRSRALVLEKLRKLKR